MSPADLIQELRDGLEGTTKGTWRPGHLENDDHSCDCGFVFDSLDRQGSIATVNMDDGGQFGSEYPSRSEAKANLKHIIAAQPDNIRTLLDSLASKDTALAEIRADRDAWLDASIRQQKRARAAESELARVKKALERIETVAKDRSEKAWFRLDSIADEAHYAILPRAASRAISQDGEERS